MQSVCDSYISVAYSEFVKLCIAKYICIVGKGRMCYKQKMTHLVQRLITLLCNFGFTATICLSFSPVLMSAIKLGRKISSSRQLQCGSKVN